MVSLSAIEKVAWVIRTVFGAVRGVSGDLQRCQQPLRESQVAHAIDLYTNLFSLNPTAGGWWIVHFRPTSGKDDSRIPPPADGG
jgi:hypothetical protein